MYVHATYHLYIFMFKYINVHTLSWFYETVWTCTYICSDTYVPFCPILSRWSGFQMAGNKLMAFQKTKHLRLETLRYMISYMISQVLNDVKGISYDIDDVWYHKTTMALRPHEGTWPIAMRSLRPSESELRPPRHRPGFITPGRLRALTSVACVLRYTRTVVCTTVHRVYYGTHVP